ncbi:Toxin HigB-2 [Burkholderiaceae bacterium]|jgi:hypothetical protein
MTAARIFTTKTFSKWQRKTGMGDQSLIKAIQEIQSGLVDAQLAELSMAIEAGELCEIKPEST